ncbi:F-box/LRR-repeat protein 25-like [Eucalyptus grandis]|uniref:F-box/LRR-repeat protein 25-like n=1 Tax=Eucalyptus grandis TaxID=71139 RepID=UPI00192EF3D0|nr:F-box/LRR-repeat protein 25-like [Eucalyptus grandis]
MATHSVHRKSSGDRPNRAQGNRHPPPLSPGDLISALPDAVIHHIFSFLPLKDVVKTSVLSKRWRCTWTSTTHLAFNGVRPRNHDASSFDFPSVVDSVLRQCTSPTVKKFHVTDLQYHEADRPKVDRWLHFAAGRRVEDLYLSLITKMWSMYILPPSLYCWSWLVRLEVSLCSFSLDLTISWPCLKVLSMEYAELSDDFLGRILKGSPVLESLELRQCWRMTNIIIDSTSVKDLLLIGANNCHLEKIWAPHLLSLHVSGMWHHRIFRLDDISSLVKADLVFSIRTFSLRDKGMCYDLCLAMFVARAK